MNKNVRRALGLLSCFFSFFLFFWRGWGLAFYIRKVERIWDIAKRRNRQPGCKAQLVVMKGPTPESSGLKEREWSGNKWTQRGLWWDDIGGAPISTKISRPLPILQFSSLPRTPSQAHRLQELPLGSGMGESSLLLQKREGGTIVIPPHLGRRSFWPSIYNSEIISSIEAVFFMVIGFQCVLCFTYVRIK